MSYQIEEFTTDVLVIGGGLAGSTAALQAREEGQEVIVLEAANTYRSGNAGTGVDHVFSYVPPVHERVGYSKEDMKKDMVMFSTSELGLGYTDVSDMFVDTSFERITSLEKYGISFDFDDPHLVNGYRLVPQWQSAPTSFNFKGRDIKVKLTEAMLKAGVQIVNRSEAVKLLTTKDGEVAGAIAVSTREDKIIVVTAKTTILTTTAGVGRLSENRDTTYNYREHPTATECGIGISLPMNAGAEVTNLEFSFSNFLVGFEGFSFTVGAPGGSWWPAGRIVDEDGNVIVEKSVEYDIDEPDYLRKNQEDYKKYNEQKAKMAELVAEGKQLYFDLKEATDEELEFVEKAFNHEGKMWLYLKNLKEEGLELRDIRLPMKGMKRVIVQTKNAGVLVDVRCESTVRNLFAAGESMGAVGCCFAPGAIVYGYEAGLQAANRAKEIANAPTWDKAQLDELINKVEEIKNRENGNNWQAVEKRLQSIMQLFGVSPLTDDKIEQALALIKELKQSHNLQGNDQYEVTKSLEVLSLLDSAEAIFTAAQIRTESIANFVRVHNGENRKATKREIYGLYYDENGDIKYRTHEPAKER